MVLQSADVWKLDDIAEFSGLNVSMFRRVHVEREVRAPAVVIIEIARKWALLHNSNCGPLHPIFTPSLPDPDGLRHPHARHSD